MPTFAVLLHLVELGSGPLGWSGGGCVLPHTEVEFTLRARDDTPTSTPHPRQLHLPPIHLSNCLLQLGPKIVRGLVFSSWGAGLLGWLFAFLGLHYASLRIDI
jgi:hypothetical protein